MSSPSPSGLDDLKPEEAIVLLAAVGRDFDGGVEAEAARLGVPREELMAALAECGASNLTQPGHRAERWLARHFLDLLGIAAVVLVAVLAARAQGWLRFLGAPWGLTERVPVAARPLERGQESRAADAVRIWQNPEPEALRSPAEVRGMRLARDLAAGSLLRRSDFERVELVAAAAIPLGTRLEAKHLALAWAPYEPAALGDPRQAVGKTALRPFAKGAVLCAGDLR